MGNIFHFKTESIDCQNSVLSVFFKVFSVLSCRKETKRLKSQTVRTPIIQSRSAETGMRTYFVAVSPRKINKK